MPFYYFAMKKNQTQIPNSVKLYITFTEKPCMCSKIEKVH